MANPMRFVLTLFASILAASACGGDPKIQLPDGGAGGLDVCDVLKQERCQAGEKCTWIRDATTPTPLGHIGCVPEGSVAVGESCAYGMPGPTGFDNCAKGTVCVNGRCTLICDPADGAACSAKFACQSYSNLFEVNSRTTAGVCDPQCDPFLDNDFDGSGTRSVRQPNSPCAADEGCFGFPGRVRPTVFTCSFSVGPTLTHRSPCTVANGCSPSANALYINGCAPGYIPLLSESTGSSEAICVAYCKPQDCYAGAGNCPNGQQGAEPYPCKAGGILQGTFAPTTEACAYSWRFEYDTMGRFIRSATSDTVGFCIDHNKYKYGSGANPPIWPDCSQLNVGQNENMGFDAAFFGCVSTAKATELGRAPIAAAARAAMMDFPRIPYRAVVRASE